MSEKVISTDTAQVSDEIIHDKKALKIKHQVMDKMKNYSVLNNISDACKFIAGPLFTIGATLLITAMTAGTSLVIGTSLLAGATTILGIAVGTGYAASRLWQSGQFDNFELNAESTARHLVKELQSSRVSITEEHTQNARADGKKWVQVTNKEQMQQLQTQT